MHASDPALAVVVVGAGIGGLAAALALSRAGAAVTVLERENAVSEIGAGIALWPNGVACLHRLGVGAELEQISSSGAGPSVRSPSGRVLSRVSSGDFRDRFGEVLAVHRGELQRLLLAACRAQGVEILLGACVSLVSQDGRIVCRDGRHFQAGLVVGADGIGSAVRRSVFPSYGPARTTGITAWRWIVDTADARDLHAQLDGWVPASVLGRGQEFGILPLTHDRLYCFASSATRADGTIATLEDYRTWPGPFAGLIDSGLRAEAMIRRDLADLPPLPAYTRGHVALLGDAAHAMTPHLGQGACQALEDALVLADAISQSTSLTDALAHYDAQRVPRATAVQRGSRASMRIAAMSSPTWCAIRDRVIALIPPAAVRRSMRTWVKTSHLPAGDYAPAPSTTPPTPPTAPRNEQ